jgi:erythromycin esterase-like protein
VTLLRDYNRSRPEDRPQAAERLERAIGVIYSPETERLSHYFHARMTDQFDAVIHFDETSAVEPLPHTQEKETPEVPETYPVGV